MAGYGLEEGLVMKGLVNGLEEGQWLVNGLEEGHWLVMIHGLEVVEKGI